MKFEIGEIAIGQNFTGNAQLNGEELEIIGELCERRIFSLNGIPCEPYDMTGYYIKRPGGENAVVRAKYLRKKKPPEIDWVEKLHLVKKEGVTA